ncbi:pentatricopeptide repeat-containing protein 2 mitochondrial-like isoform X1 [Biomphalaria pfeifferi]|uniref:Pentatricopeptide repeat-containing protein 2 mitochondrial-like isoform X1 n=1 Tax=Biomphalaria pfeifferi TaxID=112525 RepID=A0AAD8BDL9_BIOPF|nr:pentatricopeptide repeat-containing protein 2 mitochondrial-like isoform X1 [Biomphalaria pfeifferi]
MAMPIRKYCNSLFIMKLPKYLNKNDRRQLFSEADLKLDRFQRQRVFKKDEFGVTGKNTILKKLECVQTSTDAKSNVYSLIDLIHIAENKEDLHILKRVTQLISKSDINTIENFSFGASLLRLYYYLGLPIVAYEMYKDPACHEFLSDNTCHRILMDMLYCHKYYNETLDVLRGLKKFNIDCVTLALASCYHINTEESFLKAHSIVKNNKEEHVFSRRALLFYSMLCIRQNKPDQALQILTLVKENNLSKNIKLMALAKSGQGRQIMEVLETIKDLSENVEMPLLCRIYSDTMTDLEQVLKEKLRHKEFANFCFLQEDLSDRAVLSRQTVSNLLERIIPGNIEYWRRGGKQKVIRDFSSVSVEAT